MHSSVKLRQQAHPKHSKKQSGANCGAKNSWCCFVVAVTTKLASKLYRRKRKNYILSNNTVHNFTKTYQKNLKDEKIDQAECIFFTDLYIE